MRLVSIFLKLFILAIFINLIIEEIFIFFFTSNSNCTSRVEFGPLLYNESDHQKSGPQNGLLPQIKALVLKGKVQNPNSTFSISDPG